jgi:hypothetical protein
MNDLRKAAEMAWKYFEDAHGLKRTLEERLQSKKHYAKH